MELASPFEFLSPENFGQDGSIVVLTGGRGVGKTTACSTLVRAYRQAGFKVSGLLTPGRYVNQKRNGIWAVDLETQEGALVASTVPGEIDGVRFGGWMFDSQVFEWGNRRLSQMAWSDVLILDELGFLEFDLNTGWKAGVEVLQKGQFHLALVVIRPECIEAFSQRGFQFLIQRIDYFSSPFAWSR